VGALPHRRCPPTVRNVVGRRWATSTARRSTGRDRSRSGMNGAAAPGINRIETEWHPQVVLAHARIGVNVAGQRIRHGPVPLPGRDAVLRWPEQASIRLRLDPPVAHGGHRASGRTAGPRLTAVAPAPAQERRRWRPRREGWAPPPAPTKPLPIVVPNPRSAPGQCGRLATAGLAPLTPRAARSSLLATAGLAPLTPRAAR
jgi:hypothetical protein